jgi:hypothetical protein
MLDQTGSAVQRWAASWADGAMHGAGPAACRKPQSSLGGIEGTIVMQNSSEYQRWEDRFAVPDYAFGKEPNYFLASCRPLLPCSGKALAVTDGEGRNGVWLAEQGRGPPAHDVWRTECLKGAGVGFWPELRQLSSQLHWPIAHIVQRASGKFP